MFRVRRLALRLLMLGVLVASLLATISEAPGERVYATHCCSVCDNNLDLCLNNCFDCDCYEAYERCRRALGGCNPGC